MVRRGQASRLGSMNEHSVPPIPRPCPASRRSVTASDSPCTARVSLPTYWRWSTTADRDMQYAGGDISVKPPFKANTQGAFRGGEDIGGGHASVACSPESLGSDVDPRQRGPSAVR